MEIDLCETGLNITQDRVLSCALRVHFQVSAGSGFRERVAPSFQARHSIVIACTLPLFIPSAVRNLSATRSPSANDRVPKRSTKTANMRWTQPLQGWTG